MNINSHLQSLLRRDPKPTFESVKKKFEYVNQLNDSLDKRMTEMSLEVDILTAKVEGISQVLKGEK